MAIRAIVISYDNMSQDSQDPNSVNVTLTAVLLDTSIPKVGKFTTTFSVSGAGTIAQFNNAIADAVRTEAAGYDYNVPNNGVLLPQFVRF